MYFSTHLSLYKPIISFLWYYRNSAAIQSQSKFCLYFINERKASFPGVHLAFTPSRVKATGQTSHTDDLVSQDMTVHFMVFPIYYFKKEDKRKRRKCHHTPNSYRVFRNSIITEARAITVLVNISFLDLQYSNHSQYHCFVAELNIPMACSCIISSLGIPNYSSH